MSRMLVVYASRYGQTERIARRIAQRLEAHGHEVTLSSARRPPSRLDPAGFAGVVAGAPLYGQRFPSYLRAWLRRWRPQLAGRLLGFFSVSGAAAGDDPAAHAKVAQLRQGLYERVDLHPPLSADFAGAIPYSRYDPLTRRLMRWIVGRSGGDTDTSRDFEYTDWAAVDAFADRLGARLQAEGQTELPERSPQPQPPAS